MNSQYHITFTVDGKRTEQTITAFSIADAKKLIEAQYSGHRVTFFGVKQL